MHIWKINKFKIEDTITNTAWLGVLAGILALVDPYKISVAETISPASFMIAGFILSLTLGIYFKNRLPGVLLVLLLIADCVYFVINSEPTTGMFVAVLAIRLILIYTFAKGAKALYMYHKHILNE